MRIGRFLSVSVLGLAINVGTASWVAVFTEPVRWLARWWPLSRRSRVPRADSLLTLADTSTLSFLVPRHELDSAQVLSIDAANPFVPSIDEARQRLMHLLGLPAAEGRRS